MKSIPAEKRDGLQIIPNKTQLLLRLALGLTRTWSVMLVSLTNTCYCFQLSQRIHDDVMLLLLQVPVKNIFTLILFFWACFLICKNEQVGQDQGLHNGILKGCFVWPVQGFLCIYFENNV